MAGDMLSLRLQYFLVVLLAHDDRFECSLHISWDDVVVSNAKIGQLVDVGNVYAATG